MGFGTILGGALAGLGKGVAQQGELDWNAKREAALEALRAQNKRDEAVLGSGLRKEEATHEGGINRANAKADNIERTEGSVRLAQVQGGIQAGRDATQHGYARELKNMDIASDAQLERLRSQLQEGRSRSEILLRNRIERGEIDGNPMMGNDGNYWIKKKGSDRFENSGVRFATTAEKKGDDADAGGTIAAAVAKRNGTAPAAGGKTVTRAEVARDAKARGIPMASAERALSAAGVKIVD